MSIKQPKRSFAASAKAQQEKDLVHVGRLSICFRVIFSRFSTLHAAVIKLERESSIRPPFVVHHYFLQCFVCFPLTNPPMNVELYKQDVYERTKDGKPRERGNFKSSVSKTSPSYAAGEGPLYTGNRNEAHEATIRQSMLLLFVGSRPATIIDHNDDVEAEALLCWRRQDSLPDPLHAFDVNGQQPQSVEDPSQHTCILLGACRTTRMMMMYVCMSMR